jgi:hypothetical protein
MLVWAKRIKGKGSYLVSPEEATPAKKHHVYTTKVLPKGKVVRVLDRQVHDKALRAATAALRNVKAVS